MIADIDERASQLAEMTYQLHSVGAHGTHRIVCGVVCHLREYAVVNTVGLAAHEREERDALEPIGSLISHSVGNTSICDTIASVAPRPIAG